MVLWASRVTKDIIKENQDEFVQVLTKKIFHLIHKLGRGVGDAKRHDQNLIKPAPHFKRSFMNAFWRHQRPSQFMNMMKALLGEYLDKFVLVFLDDVPIYSANPQDHAEHLQKVLGKLREHKLFAKASKCEILKTSVEFLG